MARVAVENSLSEVCKMLRQNGYEVVDLGNWQQVVDAIVITGQDINVLGDQNKTITGAPVINAEGMTVNEIFHAVHERLSPTKHR
ncbi:YkuS family protein [Brevibacillus formosus]|uniref:YkuS family protein n=1 Tax=Brevibacillus formosus TaxID=54913 RepID=A0A837KQ37_9BACL|nr:YkuS family protein [Brevibacillus formosus]KLH99684.1 hypothetical protein AA984_06005 [Brevibacillus formosus]MED1959760.1 YkuS family protein [Brevibacillus formosus]PSJ95737.1 hypothetical protein C7R91_13560 [Brevibacillus formosus]GED56080.1 hypothetical protein BFO01nite_02120 [Brevibacillus formosus]